VSLVGNLFKLVIYAGLFFMAAIFLIATKVEQTSTNRLYINVETGEIFR
jgi:hypothetical protein